MSTPSGRAPHPHEEPFSSPHFDGPPQGRLVLVLEHELSHASRAILRRLLHSMVGTHDITMVSGLSRASVVQAEAMDNGLFYNRRDYLSPEQACRMLPWREIWLIAGGRVWSLSPH